MERRSKTFVIFQRLRQKIIISAAECFEIYVETRVVVVLFNATIISAFRHRTAILSRESYGIELRLMLHVSHVSRSSAAEKKCISQR